MAWMIRNDGIIFEVSEIVTLEQEQREDIMSSLAWLYDHTKCIVTGYMIIKMFVIWSRSKNRYLTPDRYLTSYTYKERSGYLTVDYILRIRDVLNEVDFRMRMNDSQFSESIVMQEKYLEEFFLLWRITKIQLEQEFIYAFDDGDEMDELGYENSITFIDKSAGFDWTIIMSSFLDANQKFRKSAVVLKNGEKIKLVDFISRRWNIPVSYNLGIVNRKLAARRFSEGRSVYFILGEAGYGWSRVLSYIEAIRRSESSKIERRMGLW